MANSTIWETLGIRTPDIEVAQMLARDINSTYVPDEEVTIFTTAVSNSTLVAQQTLQIARNARYACLCLHNFIIDFFKLQRVGGSNFCVSE